MADITLSDGREITFDLYKMTRREYMKLYDKQPDFQFEQETIARVAGLSVDEFIDLAYPDWQNVCLAFFRKARTPLADPS